MYSTKMFIYLFIALLLASCSNKKAIEVNINRNIETAAILYLISDIGLNAHKGSLSYEARQHFDAFSDHEVIDMLKEFINQDGLWSPIHLFLIIDEFPNADISLAKYTQMECKVKYDFINQFIKSTNDFYLKANVEKFILEHKDYYNKCINEVTKNLPDEHFVPSMEHYYGNKFNSYNIIPSPVLFPYIGIGFPIEYSENIDIYYIAGSFEDSDSTQKYRFSFDSPTDIREMSVHEFGHSFVNTIMETKESKNMIAKYDHLFEPIKDAMVNQAYGDWNACVNEHIVRLGEIRIALAMNDTISANKLRAEYIDQRKFIYLPVLENQIIIYENNRDKYNTFADFFPELINSFSEIDINNIKF